MNRSTEKPTWMGWIHKYQRPSVRISLIQLANSILPYLVITSLMVALQPSHYLLSLLLAPLGAGFLLRIFMIQHDCGHQAFFANKRMNDLVGFLCGILTLTPYQHWRKAHALHHAGSGDLDFRIFGDVEIKAVEEYFALVPTKRRLYRLSRHPLVMFTLGPIVVLLFNQRAPFSWKYARTAAIQRGLLHTDLLIILFYGAWIAIAGWGAVVATFFPVFLLMATLGIWLFYIQHTFEEAYWRPHQHWDFTDAALKGSSFYKLPRLLQWFSGNVGYHHVHHLSPKIPNYLLERCHQENEIFRAVPTITIRESVEILRYNPALWDSAQQRLISIEEAEFWYSTKVNTISKQFG